MDQGFAVHTCCIIFSSEMFAIVFIRTFFMFFLFPHFHGRSQWYLGVHKENKRKLHGLESIFVAQAMRHSKKRNHTTQINSTHWVYCLMIREGNVSRFSLSVLLYWMCGASIHYSHVSGVLVLWEDFSQTHNKAWAIKDRER